MDIYIPSRRSSLDLHTTLNTKVILFMMKCKLLIYCVVNYTKVISCGPDPIPKHHSMLFSSYHLWQADCLPVHTTASLATSKDGICLCFGAHAVLQVADELALLTLEDLLIKLLERLLLIVFLDNEVASS